MESKPASIYLPSDLKQKLVEVAQANGFDVGRGCKSSLPKFIAVLVKEYASSTTSSTMPLFLQSLTPELKDALFKLSKMEKAQQQRASQVLELIFSTWSEQIVSESPEGHCDDTSKC